MYVVLRSVAAAGSCASPLWASWRMRSPRCPLLGGGSWGLDSGKTSVYCQTSLLESPLPGLFAAAAVVWSVVRSSVTEGMASAAATGKSWSAKESISITSFSTDPAESARAGLQQSELPGAETSWLRGFESSASTIATNSGLASSSPLGACCRGSL